MNRVEGNRSSNVASQAVLKHVPMDVKPFGVRGNISAPQVSEMVFCTFAVVLLLSGCIKIWENGDEASFESLIIRPSSLLDLCIGAVLFFGARGLKGALVGLSVFAVYGGYLIFLRASGITDCGCFGSRTPIACALKRQERLRLDGLAGAK